jgi:hypothetical protein
MDTCVSRSADRRAASRQKGRKELAIDRRIGDRVDLRTDPISFWLDNSSLFTHIIYSYLKIPNL